jgi:hypothetical protein
MPGCLNFSTFQCREPREARNTIETILLASSSAVELSAIDTRDAGEIERAVIAFARKPNGGLIVTASASALIHRDQIIALATRLRLSNVYPFRYYPSNGGLASYGPDQIDQYKRNLVSRQVAVIVATGGDPSALAAKAATTTIPIVFSFSDDPVKFGLVSSLNRPGGNATGYSLFVGGDLEAKRFDLLRELVPRAAVIAMLVDPNYANGEFGAAIVQSAARARGLRVFPFRMVWTANSMRHLRRLPRREPMHCLSETRHFS